MGNSLGFHTVTVAGRQAEAELSKLRRKYTTSGEYPFLIGDGQELEYLNESAGFIGKSFDEIVNNARRISVDDWFKKIHNEKREYEYDEVQILGEWPRGSTEKLELTVHRDILTGAIKSSVVLGLARIREPWQLPAATKYGGWNECPFPEQHCAVIRYWQEKYGAEIVSMSHDVIECEVTDPPSSQADAIQLAMEQFWYCSDIVYQGCESIMNLASTLLNSRYWYFWWD